MLTNKEKRVVDTYNRLARTGDMLGRALWVDDFTRGIYSRLPTPNRVVDVGCGSGRFIPLLEDLGIEGYLGVEPAVEQIKVTRQTHPSYEFVEGSIYSLGATYPQAFDGFILVTVLMHIQRSRLGVALTSLRACLKVGAVGFVSTPGGGGKRMGEFGLPLTCYTEHELDVALIQHGFEITDSCIVNSMVQRGVCAV